jgi:5'-deoxynucleotidase YfbR-like HD superfamily hydrolase
MEITTYDGVKIDLRNPNDYVNVSFRDVVVGLSSVTRFGGQRPVCFTLGQHSVLVALLVWEKTRSVEAALAGFLHDFEEIFLCDMPSPVKHSPEMQGYRDLCDEVRANFYAKFKIGLDVVDMYKDEIKAADNECLLVENLVNSTFNLMAGKRGTGMFDVVDKWVGGVPDVVLTDELVEAFVKFVFRHTEEGLHDDIVGVFDGWTEPVLARFSVEDMEKRVALMDNVNGLSVAEGRLFIAALSHGYDEIEKRNAFGDVSGMFAKMFGGGQ